MAEKQCNLIKNGGGVFDIGTITPRSGYAAYISSPILKKKDGIVYLTLSLSTFALNAYAGATIADIPLEYAPEENIRMIIPTSAFGGAYATIATNGSISVQALQAWTVGGYTGITATYFSAQND